MVVEGSGSRFKEKKAAKNEAAVSSNRDESGTCLAWEKGGSLF